MVGEENESRNRSSSSIRAMVNLSLEVNRYPIDLLQRFISTDTQQYKTTTASEEEEAEEEIELNLGLSLGGKFGLDKTSKKLTRSSSIAGSVPSVREHDVFNAPPVAYAVLMRTSSLPTETEEEWRKRKEIQSLRRMKAKRRRSEKQKNSRGELSLEEERRGLNPIKANWVPNWSRHVNRCNTLQGFLGQQQGSQGSLESLGGTSSGILEMDSKPLQGSSSGGESRNPMNNQPLQDRSNQETIGSSRTKVNENTSRLSISEMENSLKKVDSVENKGREIRTNVVEDMPCVFTIGDGPNGRRVEGILYKYGKGEEVRIMCVCHGTFLSPAEFIKHAGGHDVDHPLRQIVVNTSGGSFL